MEVEGCRLEGGIRRTHLFLPGEDEPPEPRRRLEKIDAALPGPAHLYSLYLVDICLAREVLDHI